MKARGMTARRAHLFGHARLRQWPLCLTHMAECERCCHYLRRTSCKDAHSLVVSAITGAGVVMTARAGEAHTEMEQPALLSAEHAGLDDVQLIVTSSS